MMSPALEGPRCACAGVKARLLYPMCQKARAYIHDQNMQGRPERDFYRGGPSQYTVQGAENQDCKFV